MRHLMLDIETFGTTPGCVVLSIGAVEFDMPRGITGKFHAHLRTASQIEAGLHLDVRTVEWWLDQSKEAQNELLKSERFNPIDVIDAFIDTFDWKDLRVWANGASFDFPIMKALFNAFGKELPWAFYNEMDFRTIKNMVGKGTYEKLRAFPTVAHDALSDATAQAQTLINIIHWINGEHNELRLAA